MTKHAFTILLSVFALHCFAFDASAGLFTPRRDKCECVGDYKPRKGVVKYYTCKIKKEWETRQHCLPCGRKVPYKVKVITYRDRYSDGTQRTWKCVVAGTETQLGK